MSSQHISHYSSFFMADYIEKPERGLDLPLLPLPSSPPPPYSDKAIPCQPPKSLRVEYARQLDNANPNYKHCFQCFVHQRWKSSKPSRPSRLPPKVATFHYCATLRTYMCDKCWSPNTTVCPACSKKL